MIRRPSPQHFTTGYAMKISLFRVPLMALILVSIGSCSSNHAAPQESSTKPQQPTPASPREPGTNRLAQETSPYLLLHAHNPVDWFPWGPEALDKAKKENKVIFLSVGYSSCHWCHVMERESFMDEEIAALLNEHFVCIKVDREERPDIDSIYMTALQVYNQVNGSQRSGGWPMSMFMTPAAKPFFGGTYFPARDGDRGAPMGFLTLLQRIDTFWKKQPKDLERDADTLTKLVQTELDGRRPAPLSELDETVLDRAIAALEQRYDPKFGGFGYNPSNPQRPKFPEPSNLEFLVNRLKASDVLAEDKQLVRKLLVGTLERMAMGGIRDHLGGGFHRYSVDRYWQIPHYEKMLYDNGQLASVYSEAHALTGRNDFRQVVDEMLEFVLREMTDERGGFYSALDAESEDEEGKFYRWERSEIQQSLAKEDYEFFAAIYGVDKQPNFEGQFYALQFTEPFSEIAKKRQAGTAELQSRLAPLRQKLLAERSKRERPLTDTKVLTSWNGLMIRGFADAGRIFENPEYIAAAERAASFTLDQLRRDDGRLLRTYGQGRAKLNAYLDDYAFLVDGLLAVYRATKNKKWLQAADELTVKQIELFWDEANGGFYFTSGDHETLIARGRDPVDGAEPSGNSVSADNLIFLARELNRPDYLERASRTIGSVSGLLLRAPSAAPRMLVAVAHWFEARK